MFLSWWRRRVRRIPKHHSQSHRRRLVFERLEDRYLLSVSPIPFGPAGSILEDLHAPPLLAVGPNAPLSFLGTVPKIMLAPNYGLGEGQAPPSRIGDGVPGNDNTGTITPHGISAGLPGNDNTGKVPPQGSGKGLPEDNNTEKIPRRGIDETSPGGGKEAKALPGGVGIIRPGAGSTEVPALGIGNLLPGGGTAGNLVAGGVRDLSLSIGTVGSQMTNLDDQQTHDGGVSATSGAVWKVAPNPAKDAATGPTALDRALDPDIRPGGGAARYSVDIQFMTGLRLDREWTAVGAGPIKGDHAGDVVADTEAGTVRRAFLNGDSASASIERLSNENAGVGTGRIQRTAAYQVGTEIGAQSGHTQEVLAGRGNGLGEKLTDGSGIPGSTLLPIGTGAGSSSSANLSQRGETPGFALAGPGRELGQWQELATPGTAFGQGRGDHTLGASSQDLSQADVTLAFRVVGSADGLELFRCDVAPIGSALGTGAMPGTAGATSVYLPGDLSSVWSLLSTYALVLPPRQRKRQPTILVVDPDDATRDALNVALVQEGYFVLPAATVHDAWGMFRTPHARIDLVLLDPHLPDISGIHLCARLREISPTLPVMVCAGEVDPVEVAKLQELGVKYYLRKPIAFEELLHTVKAILP